jgi:bifunctional non-homologous end joining protein LigD
MAAAGRPDQLAPMKATTGDLPRGDGWAFEIKWDGMRAIGFVADGRLRLQSSNLIDVTGRYPELAPLGEVLAGHRVILDGELVAFDDRGRPSFSLMQQRMHVGSPREAAQRVAAVPVVWMIYDLLHLDDVDLFEVPYLERRRLLADLVPPGPSWQVPAHHQGDAEALFDAAKEQGLEGLVAKRIDSRYEPGRRTPNWRKVKVRLRQELVVGGWLAGSGEREGRLGALLVGYQVDDGAGGRRLHYAGRVGTGFTQAELRRVGSILDPLATDQCPFDPRPPRPVDRAAHYVDPVLVAEVEFGEWTPDDRLRHPSYLGLRDDKDPADVVKEA